MRSCSRLVGLARIRRNKLDATVILQDNSRFFSARNGAAVINAVRFASSFFGKGQFIPDSTVKRRWGLFRQAVAEAPYYQPLVPPQKVDLSELGAVRNKRRKTQVCKLEQIGDGEGKDQRFRFAHSA